MADIFKMKSYNTESLEEIGESLVSKLEFELICKEIKADGKTLLVCFEEYYFRVKSYVALTILITQEADCKEAVIIGSGGGDGMINFSWGANKSMANRARSVLVDLGFGSC